MALWGSHICKALRSMENTSPATLPMYDEESVHQTKQLIEVINAASEKADIPHRQIILKAYADRLQEGVDLYHRSRLLKIMNLRCESRGQLTPAIKRAMAPHEAEFLSKYAKILADYTKTSGFDPTTPFRPPQGLNAEVKVLKDASSIMAGDSYLSLKQNEILTLRTSVAQELEQLGFVQISEYLR